MISGSGSFLVDGYLGSASDIDHSSLHTQQHPFACLATKNPMLLPGVLVTSPRYESYIFLRAT